MHVDSPTTFNKICACIHVHASYREVGAGGLGGEEVKDKQAGWQTNKQTDRVADKQADRQGGRQTERGRYDSRHRNTSTKQIIQSNI